MPIKACQGCLKDMFLTTTEAVDCFTGKELWIWGTNYCGALGNNISSTAPSPSPIQTISAGNTWKNVSVGGTQVLLVISPTVAAVKTDGSLWLWGSGANGILGNNSIINRSSPVQTVSSGTDWKEVSVGVCHTAAIKTDGTLWLWGSNTCGILGDNTVTAKSSPVQTVSGGTNWKQVSAGGFHTTAIKTDGSLWAWGFGGLVGVIGDNTTLSRSSPVQTISGGNDWKQVSAGNLHIAAIKTDGTLWTWGSNAAGQLGDNSPTSRSSPGQTVSGGVNWRYVSAGGSSTGAVKTDGTLWMWGCNFYGGLGTNNTTNSSSPVQTIAGGTNWRVISLNNSAYGSTSSIKTDGTLWNWGRNIFGQLGNNAFLNRSSPVQTVSGGTSWKHTSAGFSAAAIKETEF